MGVTAEELNRVHKIIEQMEEELDDELRDVYRRFGREIYLSESAVVIDYKSGKVRLDYTLRLERAISEEADTRRETKEWVNEPMRESTRFADERRIDDE